MTHVLPPVNTAGLASNVGASVAAAFGRRDAPVSGEIPRRHTPSSAVSEDGDADWDPADLIERRPAPTPKGDPASPARLTVGQLWEARGIAGDDSADWDPTEVRRPTSSAPVQQLTGASLAAGALANMRRG